MGYRRFLDRDGNAWEVKDGFGANWRFEPVDGDPGSAVDVPAPGQQSDPFELSKEELQALLDEAAGQVRERSKKKSPFVDD